jgi:response regulator RpfG family c-di-GMP phosphodiesterase
MKKKLNCIMLIDDSADDNFIHEREIKKADLTDTVITKYSGKKALEYLISKEEPRSDLIFLDINMPGMTGWEFLEEYNQLDKELQSHAIIIMLTTSDNSDDLARAKTWSVVSDYITKPLSKEMIKDVAARYFK